MRHDASSATEEATEWITGAGRVVRLSVDFVPSYVVKKAPAWRYQCLESDGLTRGLTRRYSGEYDAANALVQAAKERTVNSVGGRVGVQPFVVR